MSNKKEDLVYDKRLVALNTKFGYLDEKSWDAQQKKLPDLANQAEEWAMFTEETIDGSGEPTFAAIEQK